MDRLECTRYSLTNWKVIMVMVIMIRRSISIHLIYGFSNHYTKGKFFEDHKYSPTVVSKQCGAAILLRRLTETQAAPVEIPDRISLIKQLGENSNICSNTCRRESKRTTKDAESYWCTFVGRWKSGTNTSDAYQRFTG
jgi:hypothetical protein